jgi:hypothetical protein
MVWISSGENASGCPLCRQKERCMQRTVLLKKDVVHFERASSVSVMLYGDAVSCGRNAVHAVPFLSERDVVHEELFLLRGLLSIVYCSERTKLFWILFLFSEGNYCSDRGFEERRVLFVTYYSSRGKCWYALGPAQRNTVL